MHYLVEGPAEDTPLSEAGRPPQPHNGRLLRSRCGAPAAAPPVQEPHVPGRLQQLGSVRQQQDAAAQRQAHRSQQQQLPPPLPSQPLPSRRRPASQQDSPARAKAARLDPGFESVTAAGAGAEAMRPSRAAHAQEQQQRDVLGQHSSSGGGLQTQTGGFQTQAGGFQRRGAIGPLATGGAVLPPRSWVQLAPPYNASPPRQPHAGACLVLSERHLGLSVATYSHASLWDGLESPERRQSIVSPCQMHANRDACACSSGACSALLHAMTGVCPPPSALGRTFCQQHALSLHWNSSMSAASSHLMFHPQRRNHTPPTHGGRGHGAPPPWRATALMRVASRAPGAWTVRS